jgi:hypothetical protein
MTRAGKIGTGAQKDSTRKLALRRGGLTKSKVVVQLSFQIKIFEIKIVATTERNVLHYAHFINFLTDDYQMLMCT